MARIISYNVNGIRAALSKGLVDWLRAAAPDVLCLQEIKAEPSQFDTSVFDAEGYRHYWHPARKKGYSGVAILSKIEPDHVEIGCGIDHFDAEGRIIRADYGDISVISVYIPSGSSGEERQSYKMIWLQEFQEYITTLSQKRQNLVICGDYNICHKPIDIHNPVSNAKSSGFLPEERAWLESFLQNCGFHDAFRHFNSDPHQYTWWSYRAGARQKNLGWRIDYTLVNKHLQTKLNRASILPEAKHSDHCPVLLELDF